MKSPDAKDKVDVAFLGIEPGKFIEPKVASGNQLSAEDKMGVIIDESLQEKGYEIGDKIEVTSSSIELTVVGITKGETFNHLPSVL